MRATVTATARTFELQIPSDWSRVPRACSCRAADACTARCDAERRRESNRGRNRSSDIRSARRLDRSSRAPRTRPRDRARRSTRRSADAQGSLRRSAARSSTATMRLRQRPSCRRVRRKRSSRRRFARRSPPRSPFGYAVRDAVRANRERSGIDPCDAAIGRRPHHPVAVEFEPVDVFVRHPSATPRWRTLPSAAIMLSGPPFAPAQMRPLRSCAIVVMPPAPSDRGFFGSNVKCAIRPSRSSGRGRSPYRSTRGLGDRERARALGRFEARASQSPFHSERLIRRAWCR